MSDERRVIHVIDDDETLRVWLSHTLSTTPYEVRIYEGPHEFLATFDPARICCLVVDLRMPGMTGLELHETLRSRSIRVPIIIMTAHGDIPAAVRAFKSGVNDFLEKPFTEEELLSRIQVLLEQDVKLRSKRMQVSQILRKLETLTPRENEVLEHVISGKPNKLIAQNLGVTIKAIEAHRARIMTKMGFASVQELVQAVTVIRQWQEV